MKKLLLVLVLHVIAASAMATSFCITVNDVCCDAGGSSGSYTLNQNDDFDNYYMFYDTGSKNDKVEVICKLDGFEIWRRTVCGCGTLTINSPTANQHTIQVEVNCTYCSMPPCVPGTALVKVYTPSTNACATNCQID